MLPKRPLPSHSPANLGKFSEFFRFGSKKLVISGICCKILVANVF